MIRTICASGESTTLVLCSIVRLWCKEFGTFRQTTREQENAVLGKDKDGEGDYSMRLFLPDVGDHVSLPDQHGLTLGGAYAVRGPDTGSVAEVSLGMDLVCILWDRAQVRGWYEVETVFRVAMVSKGAQEVENKPNQAQRRRDILTAAEMLRFPSIQQLLMRIGFMENQDQACMHNPETYDTIAFSQIAGRSLEEFVRSGIEAGWLEEYVRKD